jgi:hypothetical protein
MYAGAGVVSAIDRFATVNVRNSDWIGSVGAAPSTALTVQVPGEGGRTETANSPSVALT